MRERGVLCVMIIFISFKINTDCHTVSFFRMANAREAHVIYLCAYFGVFRAGSNCRPLLCLLLVSNGPRVDIKAQCKIFIIDMNLSSQV